MHHAHAAMETSSDTSSRVVNASPTELDDDVEPHGSVGGSVAAANDAEAVFSVRKVHHRSLISTPLLLTLMGCAPLVPLFYAVIPLQSSQTSSFDAAQQDESLPCLSPWAFHLAAQPQFLIWGWFWPTGFYCAALPGIPIVHQFLAVIVIFWIVFCISILNCLVVLSDFIQRSYSCLLFDILQVLFFMGYTWLWVHPRWVVEKRSQEDSKLHRERPGSELQRRENIYTAAISEPNEEYKRFLPDATKGVSDILTPEFQLHRDPRWQWFLCTLLLCECMALHTFIVAFTALFAANESDGEAYYLYLGAFLLFLSVFRWFLKTVGFIIDMGKSGSAPLYLMGEYFYLVYYYLFYRTLFQNVEKFWVFALLQCLHLSHEWIVYPLRATEWYYVFSTRFQEKLKTRVVSLFSCRADEASQPLSPSQSGCANLISMIQQSGLSFKSWQAFLALEFGMRLTVMIPSAITFMSLFTFIHFSYNSSFYSFALVDDARYVTTMQYTAISVCLEIMNAFMIHVFFFRRRQRVHIWNTVRRLFSSSRVFAGWSIVNLGAVAMVPLSTSVSLHRCT